MGGGPFRFLELGPELPDAVLVQITAADALSESPPQTTDPAFVAFERSLSEGLFWLPDLRVTALQWDPEVPTIDHDVTVTFTIENQDPIVASSSSRLRFSVDDEPVGEIIVGEIGPGLTATKQLTWKARNGIHIFSSLVGPADQIAEDDETNNETTRTFTGAFLPDIVVLSVIFAPDGPSAGDTVTASLRLANGRGPSLARASTAYVFPGREHHSQVAAQVPGPVDRGERNDNLLLGGRGWPPHLQGEGRRRRRLCGGRRVQRGEFTFDGTVLSDLVVISVTWTPQSPKLGEIAIFILEVTNVGEGRAGNFNTSVFVNGGSTSTQNLFIPGLRKGETASATFSWTAVSGGHTFRVVTDGGGVLETDESNNARLAFLACGLRCP